MNLFRTVVRIREDDEFVTAQESLRQPAQYDKPALLLDRLIAPGKLVAQAKHGIAELALGIARTVGIDEHFDGAAGNT
jgi:hypothetical protein